VLRILSVDKCAPVPTGMRDDGDSLNTEKPHFIHFRTKNSQPIDTSMCLENNRTFNNQNTKFLGLIVDNTLSWKPHIDHLINKLSTSCYVIRSVNPYVNTNVLIMIYHSLFHSVMIYGIIFWGNSSHNHRYIKCRKMLLGLLWGVVTENVVETCSRN
jgi:hypothetical protein